MNAKAGPYIRALGMMFPVNGIRQTVVPVLPGVQVVFKSAALPGS
jgi:hypothetical protein